MNIVVVGAGLAGANAVDELRTQGYSGDITLIGAETQPPYERPPLSKGLLLGTDEPESVFVHPTRWYTEHEVDLITDCPVHEIDLDMGLVLLADRQLPYDRLLIATGAQPRHLLVADESGADVVYLRTLADALDLHARLTEHILVVGAGWIGLEVAAAVRQAGGSVTIVESASLPLANVLGSEIAPLFVELHRERGVDLRLETSVAAIDHVEDRTTVRLSTDDELRPDLIVVGIGAEPDDHLAADAGLATDHGVLVDAWLRASDPHVYAAGDVANQDHPLLGRIRVEHWDTAIHQGRHAARMMLGDDTPYIRQPYFFTDQYDVGMEYVGHVGANGYDEVVIRGDLASRAATAVWIKDNIVVAGMHINEWAAIEPLRALIGHEADSALRDVRLALPALPV